MVATSLIFDFEDRSIGCKVNFKQMHFGRITDRITSLKIEGSEPESWLEHGYFPHLQPKLESSPLALCFTHLRCT